jgi:hypothetical protein
MPIAGGSTTQSGIYYQNTVAALYMGRMLDPRISDLTQRVDAVRSEAREYVDDVVVAFADGHHRFIQVKENIIPSPGNKKWQKLWQDFDNQRWDADFKNEDRMVIYLGKLDAWFSSLHSLCERARGAKDLGEWGEILSNHTLGKIEKNLRQMLSPEHQNPADSLKLFSVVEVEQRPLDVLESFVPSWMPPNNKGEKLLFSALRDLCGNYARYKIEMDDATLRIHLKNTYGIEIFPAPISKDDELNKDINELFELFTQHAAFMEENRAGSDPTALFNAVHRTKFNMGTKTRIMLGKGPLSERFKDIQKQLNTLEKDFREKYPQVADLTVEMNNAKYSESQRKEIVRAKLGNELSDQASDFLQVRNLEIRASVEELVADLDKILGSA